MNARFSDQLNGPNGVVYTAIAPFDRPNGAPKTPEDIERIMRLHVARQLGTSAVETTTEISEPKRLLQSRIFFDC